MARGEEGEVCALVSRVFDRDVAPGYAREGIDEFYVYARPEAMARRAAGDCTVLVAESDGRLVGMVELAGPDLVAMLFVEEQGRGIGKALMAEAVRLARQRDPAPARVRVHAAPDAVPFYRGLGFEAEGLLRTENGITYLPMSLPLPSGPG